MTDESMALLRQKVDEIGQAALARRVGYSPSAINQAVKGTYGGSLDNLLQRVEETFGSATVMCPVMGEISIQRCADERRKAFGATSPQRARLYLACKSCCR